MGNLPLHRPAEAVQVQARALNGFADGPGKKDGRADEDRGNTSGRTTRTGFGAAGTAKVPTEELRDFGAMPDHPQAAHEKAPCPLREAGLKRRKPSHGRGHPGRYCADVIGHGGRHGGSDNTSELSSDHPTGHALQSSSHHRAHPCRGK